MFQNIAIIFALLLNSATVYAEIYKWVDEQGKVHYGDKPISDSTEMDINISKKGHIKINNNREQKRQKLLESYADDQEREDKEKEKLKKKKEKHERNCILSIDKLKQYERASSIYNLDKEGKRVTISSEERLRKTDNLRKKIKKYCK
ncbi:MAG: DUF4124 domain-containing protein [Gammaproteobacteria bacterium]|nr:DUF4124 domain-containing protein [Gammaproteobacteria bacterium]